MTAITPALKIHNTTHPECLLGLWVLKCLGGHLQKDVKERRVLAESCWFKHGSFLKLMAAGVFQEGRSK
jgi:hypothetical protein